MMSNLERDYMFFTVEQSLKRLGRDWIDIYQVHNSKPDAIEKHNVYRTLDEIKKQGKVRFYGVSAFYLNDGIEAIRTGKPDTIQVVHNILEQEAEHELFPLALENNIVIIAREPLASGLLTGKYDGNSRFPKSDHRRGWSKRFLEEGVQKVSKLEFLKKEGRSLIHAAIRFSLCHEAVSVVIPGAKTVRQVEENVKASEVKLSSDELKNLRDYSIVAFFAKD